MASLPQLQIVHSNETWISREDFLRLTDWTRQWLNNQVRVGNVRTRETGERNGRWTEMAFAVASLPNKAREKYEAEQRVLHTQAPAQLALTAFTQQPLLPIAPRIVLDDAAAREAAERREILAPLLEWIDQPNKPRGLRLHSGAEVRTQTDMICWLAEQRGISDSTIKRMLKRYREGGEANLAKQIRKDAGESRFYSEHPDAVALVAFAALADGQGVSVRAAHRALEQQAWRLNIAQHELPSYDTTRRFLSRIDADVRVLARKGEKKFGDLVTPYIQRRYDDVYANQVWIADTMKADVEVQNDIYDWLPAGAPIRLQLSALVDYRSRFFVGYCWGVVESSVPIAAALRNAVLAHGPAEMLYCDNGKAYKKVARGALRGYMVRPGDDLTTVFDDVNQIEVRLGILARLGMSVTHCIPRHPQSKHIERQFRTVHEQYDTMWTNTYTGGAPHMRPDITSHTMAIHRRALKFDTPEMSLHPLASDYIAGFDAWLNWHHQQPMDAEGMDGRSPAEVFAAARNPKQKPVPARYELAGTFEETQTRVVIRGAIEMWGDRYVPAENDLDAQRVMLSLSGDSEDRRRVQVMYDSHDHSTVTITDERGRFLCSLDRERRLAFAPHDPETQAEIKKGMQRARGALRASKDKLAIIQRSGRLLGAHTRLETLEEMSTPINAIAMTDLITQPTPRKVAKEAEEPQPRAYANDIAKNFLTTLKGGKQ